MKVIVVNGAPGSGKSTFEYYCHQIKEESMVCSMIDFVKRVASMCGWDETKSPENRKFLSDLKDLLANWNDVPYKKVTEQLQIYRSIEKITLGTLEYFCFVDARESSDIKRLKKDFKAITVYIKRDEAEQNLKEQINHADLNIQDYDYDIVIENNGTKEDLKVAAVNFIDKLRKELL